MKTPFDLFYQRTPFGARRRPAASYTVDFTGLTDGEARPGDHASIGFTTTPSGGTITQKWGSSPGGSQYGTGANPTDYTAGDGGSLFLEVTRDGEVVNKSALIRKADPVPGADLDLSYEEGTPTVNQDLLANWTLNGNTMSGASASPSLPANFSVSDDAVLTRSGTLVEATDATYTVTVQDEYGDEFSDTFTLEVTAAVVTPVASNTTATVTDETSASLTVDVNKAPGTIWGVVINTSTGTLDPSVAQVKAGQDGNGDAAAWDHNQGTSETGTQTFAGGVTGLTEGQTYRAYTVFTDSDTTDSAVDESADFTPADVTAPIITSHDIAVSGSYGYSGSFNTDDDTGVVDIVLTASDTTPSATQIKAGQDHTGSAAVDVIADQAVSATGPQAYSGSDLDGGLTLYAHAVHTDENGNESNTLTSSASFSTAAAAVPDAFVLADWDLDDAVSGGDLDVTINSLPDRNGSDITDIEYRVDAGTWTSSGGIVSFQISGLTDDVEVDVELRAVSSVGNSAASDTKAATPTAAAGVTFTDDLSDGAGTPMAITTSITANQAWQRGTSTLSLAGTYDLSGDPTGIAWRVGSGDWVQLTSETIGSGNWSGTLAIPSDYLAQGDLQVKPVNGLNVTPATQADLTVSDVFALLGDSMTGGVSDAADSYTGTFAWREWNGSAWASVTSQTSIWPELANQLDAAGIPPAFVRYGASGSAFRPDLGGSPGGSWEHPDNTAVSNTDFYYANGLTRLNGADTGGWKALLWEQGPNDVIDGNTFYEQNLKDLIDNYQSQAGNFTGTKMIISLLGEVLDETTNLEDLRDAQLSAIATDADILRGPSWLDLDFGDDVHFGKDGPGVAQQAIGGERWWRAIETHFYGGSASLTGPIISSVSITGQREITVTFDRAVQNHTDATGWTVEDNSGTVAISSAAQGGTTAQVVLTVGADLRTDSGEVEAVLVSFGEFSSAAGATLADTETISYPPEREIDYDAGEAYPFNEVLPELDGTPDGSTTITSGTGTWQSTTAITYTYQWLDGPGGSPIGGATSASLASAPEGSVCEVTATNTAGSVSAETPAGYTPAQAFTGGLQGGWWPIEDTSTLWQDTSASTAVTTDGDPVARITDASGNDNHMLQATGTQRMFFDTDDTYQNINGDGSDDGLLISPVAADGDILMVVAADFTAATGTLISISNNDATAQYIHIEHNGVRHVSNDFGANSTVSISPTGRSVVTVVATESDLSFRVYVNGSLVGTGTKTGSGWFDTTSTDKAMSIGRRSVTNFPDHNSGAIYGGAIVIGSGVTSLRADLETYMGGLIGVAI